MNAQRIDAIEAEIRTLSIEIAGAEDWAPGWREQPEYFSLLLQTQADMEQAFRRYLAEIGYLATTFVKWEVYNSMLGMIKKLQADDEDDEDIDWDLDGDPDFDISVMFDQQGYTDQEEVAIRAIIGEIYINGIALGYSTERARITTIKEPITMTHESPITKSIQQQWDDHAFELTRYLDPKTSEEIVRSIQESIALGENQKLATNRMMRVIADAKRADLIAQTEMVRAFAMGERKFAMENGAISKTWGALPGADATNSYKPCVMNNGVTRKLTEAYPSGHQHSPAHPRCRCKDEYNY